MTTTADQRKEAIKQFLAQIPYVPRICEWNDDYIDIEWELPYSLHAHLSKDFTLCKHFNVEMYDGLTLGR